MKKTLYMETTEISPNRTVAEIQGLLADYGARSILIDYEEGGGISAVSFEHKNGLDQMTSYRIPCLWKEIKQLLEEKYIQKRRRGRPMQRDFEFEARKIAWRMALRWVESQLAFIRARQVKFEQAFLSYRLIGPNETFYERLEALKFKLPLIELKK